MSDSKKFWDKQAKRFSNGDNKETIQFINNAKSYLKSDATLMDFGCATGDSSVLFAKEVNKVVGIDYSDEMIRLANEKHKVENVSFLATTLDKYNAQMHTFDIIVALNVLHLINDLDESIKLFSRFIKPNGYLIASTPYVGEKKSFIATALTLISKTSVIPHINAFSHNQVLDKFSNYGFKLAFEKCDLGKIPVYFQVFIKVD